MINVPRKPQAVIFAKGVVTALSAIRLLPHLIVLVASSKRDYLWADLDRYAENYDDGAPRNLISRMIVFVKIMTFHSEYRNVFYLRHKNIGYVLALLCPPMPSLNMNIEKCGPGLFIHHGFGTLISAKEVGEGCSINQLVTIGYANDSIGRPSIGDNVTIAVGARVLGAVTIGDGAFISANSVILANVPPGVTMVGVPAKAVWSKPKP